MIFKSLIFIVVQQVESFPLTLNTRSSQILLEAKDSNCVVLAADRELCVYSLKGAMLASFKDHTMPISSICVVGRFLIWNSNKCHFTCWNSLFYILYNIPSLSSHLQDSFRVVTASQDLSLRVLTWRNDRDHGLTLESRYHLLGGSHTMSRYCMLYASVWVSCINGSQVSINIY